MIFGNLKSTIITQAEETVTFTKSKIGFDLLQSQDLEFRSIVNGNITHKRLGDYSVFTIDNFLWAYSNPALVFNAMKALEDTEVTFWFEGGTSIVNCRVEPVRPYYYKKFSSYAGCVMTLIPLRFISLSNYILDENGIPIQDEEGNPIKSEGLVLT